MPKKRQLAAIMFTDIVGYTALMDEDEQKALDLLKQNRSIQKPFIEKHDGRWLKEIGDGVLASFHTVSDAVSAAGAIQNACENVPVLKVRIGIHQGEVIFEDNDVFGSGVNIASRLESKAPAGGIFVSEMVARNIDNKGFVTKFIGEEKLKNVKYPVRIYQLFTSQSSFTKSNASILSIDEKSLAVLPFINLSSDPEQEYFSDGLTEELITDLSQIDALRVISRSSIVRFKGSEKPITKIAAELGVRYILEGSVRKSDNNLRINVRLINAIEDRTIWSDKYRGALDDIFAIQEQVSRSTADALSIQLNQTEIKKLSNKPITNAHAYELYQKAQHEIFRFKEDGLRRALRFLNNSLVIEGENAFIYSKLGLVYYNLINVLNKIDRGYFKKARDLAEKVFELEPNSHMGHTILGSIAFYDGYIEDAVAQIQMAYDANHNDPDNLFLLILGNSYLGRSEEAENFCKIMGKVDPYNPVYYALLALMYYMKGDMNNAFENSKKAYNIFPEIPQVQLYYAYYLVADGDKKSALPIVDRFISETTGSIFSALGILFKSAILGNSTIEPLTEEAKEKLKLDVEWSWLIADFYSMMNKKEEAIDWLEHIVNRGFINYPLLSEYDPYLENIRKEPRYIELMKKAQGLYGKSNG